MASSAFKDKKLNLQRLLDYGFAPGGGGYIYSAGLLDGQFDMRVAVSAEGGVSAQVIDVPSGEEYVLHRVPGAGGAFVGRVKEEYEALLGDIAERCFDRDVFKSEYAKLVIRYARETYGSELEYLWEKFPTNAVWRRQDNGKWYGALLVLPKKKLGINSGDIVDVIDLRIPAEQVEAVVDGRRYFPGYHMNKKHWFTICLDGSVPVEEVFSWMDLSYELAGKKK